MTEWQPIETAPKGKKLIVAYKNALGNWRTVMARYYLPDTLVTDDSYDDAYAPEGWYEEVESHETILPLPVKRWNPGKRQRQRTKLGPNEKELQCR